MDDFLLECRFGFLGANDDGDAKQLQAQGWRKARADGTTILWLRGDPAVRDVANGWVVGDLFERGSGRPAKAKPVDLQATALDAEVTCQRLLEHYWGRYVALFPAQRAVLRDPSAHLECLSWSSPTAWIVASDLPEELPAALLPRDLAIDWAVVAGMVANEGQMGGTLALKGVESIRPGSFRTFTARPVDRALWNPAAFAADPHGSYEQSRRAVREAVEESLAAEAATQDTLLAEISGGLDSAIVATTLAKAGAAQRTHFVHFHVPGPGADERAFAREVANRIGSDLLEITKPALQIDEATLGAMPIGVRPSNNAMDRHYDEVQVELLGRFGARRILTGQGGDMVFYQAPSQVIATELVGRWARRPRADTLWRGLENAARWNRCSTWSLIGAAVREHLSRRASDEPTHPWLAQPVAPAKRRTITSLIHSQALFNGASLRSRRAHLIHPLLHQPVLEATLAAPVIDLARGGWGRGLARDAFGDQLPERVRWRRSKGDLTSYYGRMVLGSLPVLRAYLLQGRLAAEHVLDGKALEEGLEPDRMIHEGNYPRLFQIIAIEAFVRHWEARLSSAVTVGAPSRSASQGSTSP